MKPRLSFFEIRPGRQGPQVRVGDIALDDLGQAAHATDALNQPIIRIYARNDHGGADSLMFQHRVMTCVIPKLGGTKSATTVIVKSRAGQTFVTPMRKERFYSFHPLRQAFKPLYPSESTDEAIAAAKATLQTYKPFDHPEAQYVIEVSERAEGDDGTAVQALLRSLEMDDDPDARMAAAASPPTSPAEAARRQRESFLDRGWPSSIDVAVRMRSEAVNQAQVAADLRKRGALLGAWSHRGGTFVHPDFQFDANGQPRPELPRLLATLRELTLDPDGRFVDKGGWRRVFWLYGTRSELDDRTPAEVFSEAPERVIQLAENDLAEAVGNIDQSVGA